MLGASLWNGILQRTLSLSAVTGQGAQMDELRVITRLTPMVVVLNLLFLCRDTGFSWYRLRLKLAAKLVLP